MQEVSDNCLGGLSKRKHKNVNCIESEINAQNAAYRYRSSFNNIEHKCLIIFILTVARHNVRNLLHLSSKSNVVE